MLCPSHTRASSSLDRGFAFGFSTLGKPTTPLAVRPCTPRSASQAKNASESPRHTVSAVETHRLSNAFWRLSAQATSSRRKRLLPELLPPVTTVGPSCGSSIRAPPRSLIDAIPKPNADGLLMRPLDDGHRDPAPRPERGSTMVTTLVCSTGGNAVIESFSTHRSPGRPHDRNDLPWTVARTPAAPALGSAADPSGDRLVGSRTRHQELREDTMGRTTTVGGRTVETCHLGASSSRNSPTYTGDTGQGGMRAGHTGSGERHNSSNLCGSSRVKDRPPPLPGSLAEVVVLIHAAGEPNLLGSSERGVLRLLLVVNRVRTLHVILSDHAPAGGDLLGEFTVDDAVDGMVVQRSRGHNPRLPSRTSSQGVIAPVANGGPSPTVRRTGADALGTLTLPAAVGRPTSRALSREGSASSTARWLGRRRRLHAMRTGPLLT